jgi:hypothetical protein
LGYAECKLADGVFHESLLLIGYGEYGSNISIMHRAVTESGS